MVPVSSGRATSGAGSPTSGMLMAESVAGRLDDEQPARAGRHRRVGRGPDVGQAAGRAGRQRLVRQRVARGRSVVTPTTPSPERQQRDQVADRRRAGHGGPRRPSGPGRADAARPAPRVEQDRRAVRERRDGQQPDVGEGVVEARAAEAAEDDDPRRRRARRAARTASSVSDSSLAAATRSDRDARPPRARRARRHRRSRHRRPSGRPAGRAPSAWRGPAVRGDDERDVRSTQPGHARVERGTGRRPRRRPGRSPASPRDATPVRAVAAEPDARLRAVPDPVDHPADPARPRRRRPQGRDPRGHGLRRVDPHGRRGRRAPSARSSARSSSRSSSWRPRDDGPRADHLPRLRARTGSTWRGWRRSPASRTSAARRRARRTT